MQGIDKSTVMQSQTGSPGFLKKKFVFTLLRVAVEMFQLEKNDILVNVDTVNILGQDFAVDAAMPIGRKGWCYDWPVRPRLQDEAD